MKIHWDLIQGSELWFAMKWGKVGGSASKGLFVPSDTLLDEILSEHTEPFEMEVDGYVNKDMQRGIELEPLHRSEISKFAGVEFKEAGWIQAGWCPIIGISPDGITADGKISYEGKAPGRKKHISTVRNREIPSDNIHQCLHYFTVIDTLEAHYFSSFRPESNYPLWPKKLTRDSIVDLGTKATPKCKTIHEWVKIAKANALILESNLQIALTNLDKI